MNPYARAGYYAGTYGPRAAWAAGKIARFAYTRFTRRNKRKYAAKKKENVGRRAKMKFGDPPHSSNLKSTLHFDDIRFYVTPTRTLSWDNVLLFKKGPGLDERIRDIINFRGIKTCIELSNNTTKPMYVNVCLLSRKDRLNDRDQSNVTDIGKNFFRGHGNDRSNDFASTSSGLSLNCANLNTDKFLIHWRKRVLLGSKTSTTFTDNREDYMEIMKYTAFKRQLRFEDPGEGDSNAPVNANLYLVWWCVNFGEDANIAPAAGALNFNHRTIRYFRETSTLA